MIDVIVVIDVIDVIGVTDFSPISLVFVVEHRVSWTDDRGRTRTRRHPRRACRTAAGRALV